MSKVVASNPNAPARIMSDDEKAVINDLNSLVVNCGELRELEQLLGNFNLFRVLRFEHGEIRHSNVLAWLLQPNEAHGLNDLFLRRWLMRVFHDSDSEAACYLDPVAIDSVEIRSVEVFREWNNIDLVVQLETFDHGTWVVAIENKVRAKQRGGQLPDYLATVKKAFPKAKCLFLFLTKYSEEPEDKNFAAATYAQVYDVLSGCVAEQNNAIGEEPKVLLNHYLRILKESFMENPEITALAKQIYQKHRRALDVIFENRSDDHQRLTDALEKIMKGSANGAGLIPMVTNKAIVRFLPKEWKTEWNLAGTAWGETGSAYLLCELNVWRKFPRLEVVEGHSPKAWRQELWKISNKEKFTKATTNNGPEAEWMRAYSAKSPIRVVHSEIEDFDGKAQEIWNWCEQQMAEAEFKRVLKAVADHLKKLPPIARTGGS